MKTKKQKGVIRGTILGVLVTILALVLTILYNPFNYPLNLTFIEQLEVVFKSSILITLCLFIPIARLTKHRFLTAEDFDGGSVTKGSMKVKRLQFKLQSTFEQAILALFVYCAWIVIMPAEWIGVIPIMAILFLCGRILFFLSYEQGTISKTLGLALSFYPTSFMLFSCLLYPTWQWLT